MKTFAAFTFFLVAAIGVRSEDAPLSLLRDHEVVSTFANLPVQEEGGIKPLDTVARHRLLVFLGKHTIVYE